MRSMLSPELKELIRRLAKEGPHKTLKTPRRVRCLFNGLFILDTVDAGASALYVWEHKRYPQFYLPLDAFAKEGLLLSEGEKIRDDEGRVVATQLKVNVRPKARLADDMDSNLMQRALTEAVRFAEDLTGPAEVLRGLVKVDFGAVDQWFEEDTPIHVHPKDPFKRIDILQSDRPIRITLNSHTLAESSTSMHLYETTLPTRYYLPLTSLNNASLRPSETRSLCPYKGEAQYHDVVLPNGEVYRDLVWYYTRPTSESAGIVNLRCFYNEKVDVWIKGVGEGAGWRKMERPVTHFV